MTVNNNLKGTWNEMAMGCVNKVISAMEVI
jgi:hypothetical protein